MSESLDEPLAQVDDLAFRTHFFSLTTTEELWSVELLPTAVAFNRSSDNGARFSSLLLATVVADDDVHETM